MRRAVLDIETGGFSTTKNGVCEIGLVLIDENYNLIDKFHTLIKPYKREDSEELVSYKEDAMSINGLTVERLIQQGLPVQEAMLELAKFFVHHDINTIIGHNSNAFDVPRVEYLLNRFCSFSISHVRNVDTLLIAKAKLNLPSYNLQSLCEYFGIDNKIAHSALSDAEATLEVYKKLI